MGCDKQAVFMAETEKIPVITNFILQKASTAGLSEKRMAHLELAMEEILTNIINYAYEISPGEVSIEIQNEENSFKVSIIDNGPYFDPLSIDLPDTNAKLDDRPIGGLGIMLIRNIIDEVYYLRANEQNKITLVLYKDK